MSGVGTTDDADPGWLTEPELDEWKAVVALMTTLPAALDSQLRSDAGLNMFEYHILVQLGESPSRMVAMTDLALLAQGSLSRVSHAVSRLEKAGWVERTACAEAGRRTGARLTDAGLAKLHDAAPGHVREARRLVVDVLTAEQLTSLGECARRIVGVANPTIATILQQQQDRVDERA